MYFSLIVATLNRIKELDSLFDSFLQQNHENFEVIVVDQNEHNLVQDICNAYSEKLNIRYFKVNFKGLSKARNFGIKYATGSIIAFPDDDCLYSKGVLSFVNDYFNNNKNVNILTGDTLDIITKNKYLKTSSNEKIISYRNVFKSAISYTIFIRYNMKSDITFDEKLGVGSFFGSAEESDLIIRLLKKKYIGIFTPKFLIYHPVSRDKQIPRNYNYSLGFGAVHKKHFDVFELKLNYCFFLIISLVKMVFLLDFKLNFFILKGKILGFLKY